MLSGCYSLPEVEVISLAKELEAHGGARHGCFTFLKGFDCRSCEGFPFPLTSAPLQSGDCRPLE